MEIVLKIYIIGFVISYILFSLAFIYYEGQLKDLIIICCMSWLSLILNILLILKNLFCKKYYNKFKYKYWFHMINEFNSIDYYDDKKRAMIRYLDVKLKDKGIAPYSSDGLEIKERFVRRYF